MRRPRPDIYHDTLGAILRAEIRRGVKPRPVDIGNARAAAAALADHPLGRGLPKLLGNNIIPEGSK